MKRKLQEKQQNKSEKSEGLDQLQCWLPVLVSTFNISLSTIVQSKTPRQLLSFPMSNAYVTFPDIPCQPRLTTIYVRRLGIANSSQH